MLNNVLRKSVYKYVYENRYRNITPGNDSTK